MQIQSVDGTTLNGWLLNHQTEQTDGVGESPLLIYFSGNSLNRYERINDLRVVAARGFDVLIFDYRGYGDSTGTPTDTALTSDAKLVWRFACE